MSSYSVTNSVSYLIFSVYQKFSPLCKTYVLPFKNATEDALWNQTYDPVSSTASCINSFLLCAAFTGHHRNRLTISVGQQLHQPIKTRVPHLADVGGTAADGLDRGSHKVFIHAFNICLQENKTHTGRRRLGNTCLLKYRAAQLLFLIKHQCSAVSLYLKLSEDGGNVRLIGQIGENLQLQKRHETLFFWTMQTSKKHKYM